MKNQIDGLKKQMREFHGKTENMGRPRKPEGEKFKRVALRLHPEKIEFVKALGGGCFADGINTMIDHFKNGLNQRIG